MKKLAILASLAAMAVAVPAQAHKPDGAPGMGETGASHSEGKGGKPEGAGSKGKKKGHKNRCTRGYIASGLFVEGTLTQTEGADTEKRRDDRYSGTLTVDVKRGNRHAKSDVGTTKTYTLTDVRVRFADTNGDGKVDEPAAGDRVKVFGRITRDSERCNPSGDPLETTINKVKFGSPPAAPEAPAEAAPTS